MKQVLVFVTDGFADWEAGYVTAEINKHGTGYQVKAVAIDDQPKISMGGLTVLPDFSMEDVSLKEIAMLIIPGGTGWREEKNQKAVELVGACMERDIPVAAICDATTFLGKHGFLDDHEHTGNSLPYLKESAPEYRGDENYINAQSVSDGFLITANGSGALEFSRDILEDLHVLEGEGLKEWYGLFKEGFVKS
ncbi:glutamine amidotransferase [Halobacillus yeomjeoni]|uniref:type 1 glutamine amidotransferase family protein n=1 Tax=Halobacillus yeomjeoni TaxID=311194 RepID=UPI001CD51FDB|nr:type 1 glutamine amidotransferase family protein [Halobacillus yeomjeoni]MCA0984390.1 glutamine amidotransferase [Halobacillus yeomjeoni]